MSIAPAPQAEIQLPELPLIQRWRTTGWGSSGIIEDSEGEYVDHDDHVAAMRAYAQAALNARAGGDDSARLSLLIDSRFWPQKLRDTGRWVLLTDEGYLAIDGHYATARDAIDAALASQAVGVKDGR